MQTPLLLTHGDTHQTIVLAVFADKLEHREIAEMAGQVNVLLDKARASTMQFVRHG